MSVSRSLAWMGASQFLALFLQFTAQVVLVRHLTLHEAGIYAIGVAIVGVLALAQTLGLQAFIIREEVLTPAITATVFTVNAFLSTMIAVALFGISYAGASFVHDSGVQRVLAVLAVTPLITIFSFLPAAMLEREGRFKEIALVGTAGSIASTIAIIVLALSGYTYLSAAYAQWANEGVVAVLMTIIGRRHASLRVGFHAWRRVGNFGLQMLAVSGISTLGIRLSDIILARFLGLSALGLYSRASSLNGMIWVNVHLLAGRVMLVDYAQIHRQGLSLRDRYIQTVDVVTVVLWPTFAGFAVLAGPFIFIAYGAKWVPAASPLIFLAVASMTLVAITMTYELFAATGELKTQTRIEFIRSIFALLVFIGGCAISLEAAAAARVAEAAFAIFLYRPHLNRMTDTSMKDFLPIYGRNLMLTALAVLPAGAVMTAFGWAANAPLLPLAASIFLGILLWAGALHVIGHPLLMEVRKSLRTA